MTPLKKDPLLPTVIATILAKEHKAILITSVWVRMCFTGIATNSMQKHILTQVPLLSLSSGFILSWRKDFTQV